MVARPQLVILDEPFSGLDPVNLEALKDAVVSLRENGTTVVFSTHDMDMAERMCDTIFMIFEGRKVLDGSLSAIQADFPADRVRIRLADGEELPSLNNVQDVERSGRSYLVRLADPTVATDLLRRLADNCTVEHFEIVKPSLHDIFVQIAGPKSALTEVESTV